MPYTVLAPTTGILWRTLIAEGVDPAPLFREMGVDPELMKEPRARVRQKAVRNLWRRAIDVTGDDCLDVKAAKHWHPSQLGALGYAWLASSTLRTALHRVSRYLRVINDNRQVLLEETPAGFVYTLSPSDGSDKLPVDHHVHLAVLIELCRANYGAQLNPLAVAFTHAEPNCAGEYFSHFRCPLEFGAEQNSLTLPMNAIDVPLPGNNPMLAKFSDQVMTEYLAHLDRAQFTEWVKALIIDQLPSGGGHRQKVADIMNLSPRTLQRRLKDEGANFTNLLDEVRRDLAGKYVRDDTLDLMEITFLLGFSEESAFSRAFKRWTGWSPSDYRENSDAGGPTQPGTA